HAANEEYEQEFRELFTRAIDCHIRGAARVGVFLSGGIDSSCVAGVPQQIRARAAQPPIAALTLAYPGQPCDETPYSTAVVEKWQLPFVRVDATASAFGTVDAQAARYLDSPAYPTSTLTTSLRERAAASGVGVVLTGYGGDELFTGDPAGAADLIKQGQVIRWAREIVSARLSARARDWLRPVLGARAQSHPLIRSDFGQRVALRDRLRQ